MREIGRTSVNGQKAYGNDPHNERPLRAEESRGDSERGASGNVIK